MVLQAKDIHKSYGSLQVLQGITLQTQEGEILSIVGASGSGKSTLLQILGTLDKPQAGEIFVQNTAIHQLTPDKLAQFRNQHIGFVFQFHNLLPEFSALENAALPAMLGGSSLSVAQDKAKELLDLLGLSKRYHHKPSELSGGEQQRVAVARALINQPAIVFADEPSGNLDSTTAKELHKLFFHLRDKFKQTFIIVTHNEELAQMADRTLTIQDGKIA